MTPQKRKPAPKEGGPKGKLNQAYRYGEAHVATVALVALGIGIVLSGFAFYSFFNERAIERRVTHTETACTLHPAGQKCQTTKQRSDEKRSVASACVLAYKLDKNGQLLRLTKCPVEPKRQKRIESATGQHTPAEGPTASAQPSPTPKAGDATSAPTGHSQPAPGNGGGGGSREVGGGGGGRKESPEKLPPSGIGGGGGHESTPAPAAAPTSPPAPSSPGPSSSQTTERTTETVVVEPAPEAPQPVRDGLGAVVESVGGVVEETGGTVNEVVGGVTGTTCSLARVLCPTTGEP